MRGRDLRDSLRTGKHVFGIALEAYGQPRWPHFFAGLGLDFVFIDSEHTPHNRETLAWAAQTYAAHGIAPLVRIPEPDAALAAMALDGGAHGIIAPYVETVAQVRALAGAVRYRPLKGRALETVLDGGAFPSNATEAYLADYNADAVLVIMIESPAGVAALPDLLALDAVDAVLIGPHDLSVSLGVPEGFDHPDFVAAVDTIITTCRERGVGVGLHTISGSVDDAYNWAARGCNLICHRTDTLFVARGIQQELGGLRRALESGDASQLALATINETLGADGHRR